MCQKKLQNGKKDALQESVLCKFVQKSELTSNQTHCPKNELNGPQTHSFLNE